MACFARNQGQHLNWHSRAGKGFSTGNFALWHSRVPQNHLADTVREGAKQIRLMSRREFVEYMFQLAYKARVWVVGVNVPFDLSRLAVNC